jgi:hypothetical protein
MVCAPFARFDRFAVTQGELMERHIMQAGWVLQKRTPRKREPWWWWPSAMLTALVLGLIGGTILAFALLGWAEMTGNLAPMIWGK